MVGPVEKGGMNFEVMNGWLQTFLKNERCLWFPLPSHLFDRW